MSASFGGGRRRVRIELEWLREAWGPAADTHRGGTRKTEARSYARCSTRALRRSASDAVPRGAIDARAPKFDGGIVTRVDCVSLGIVVNRNAQRFYDEGEDFWPKRYAIWGRLVAQQPEQIAYSIIDSKATGRFMPTVFPGEFAQSIEELADKLGLSRSSLRATVDHFNVAVIPGMFNHAVLDDCVTAGIALAKTHWAQKIDAPPFFGYPLRRDTFTYRVCA